MQFFIKHDLPKSTYQSGNTILKTKDGRYFVGKNNKGKALQKELSLLLKKYAPPHPIDGALSVSILYYRRHKKTETKANRAISPLPIVTRPDSDNLAKGILDAMQATGFFKDDAQVADLHIVKAYHQNYGLGIQIQKM